jgi:hypothetical protein
MNLWDVDIRDCLFYHIIIPHLLQKVASLNLHIFLLHDSCWQGCMYCLLQILELLIKILTVIQFLFAIS